MLASLYENSYLQTNAKGMQLWSPLVGNFSIGQKAASHSSNKWWIQSTWQKYTKGHVGHKSFHYCLHKRRKTEISIHMVIWQQETDSILLEF